MAFIFDYAQKSTSCETASSSSAQELVDQINTVRHVLDYRVGDVINKKGDYWLESRQNLMDSQYSGTALHTVLKRCTDLSECTVSIEDFGKELASIGESKGFSKPGNDTIVAYIRAGDIIETPGTHVADKLRDSAVKDGIRSALAGGYVRLEFVVVEAYADRAEGGVWMYSESKHGENRRQLLAVLQELIEFLCPSDARQISFGIVSSVNADETLFYMMHASMFVTDQRNQGFNAIGEQLARLQNKDAIIL
jgi:hypothetical protein